MVKHIEIMKSPWKKGTWCIKIGDISGSVEHSNISKEQLIEFFKEQIIEEEKK